MVVVIDSSGANVKNRYSYDSYGRASCAMKDQLPSQLRDEVEQRLPSAVISVLGRSLEPAEGDRVPNRSTRYTWTQISGDLPGSERQTEIGPLRTRRQRRARQLHQESVASSKPQSLRGQPPYLEIGWRGQVRRLMQQTTIPQPDLWS